MTISLLILPDEFGIYQFDRDYRFPAEWLNELPWYTLSKTTSEVSLLCPAQQPATLQGSIVSTANKSELGWRCFQVDAQMDFGLVGILASIVDPLRDNKIPVYVVSTFDTDYVLVKEEMLEKAMGVLNRQDGITLKPGSSVIL
ncbi:ACT domain-containing protein [Zychaea mexicana]|uniref:ACT domain-containing protein n=1 Tax=Zychaea mexicana TaxID=64656 RepID=UPI0022FF0609|nr:ACT domain-containing protein [Zychaea mexicana]KAI9496640.1 ACT domain-containing protein [Zychaea mexicana]